MLGVAAIAEERTQQPSILLHDVDLGVERRAQPIPKAFATGERLAGPQQVFFLHVVVVGADDGFLALEVVVGGAEGETCAAGDVANRGFLEPAFTEKGKRGVEDAPSGLFAGGTLRDRPAGGVFEHVQSLRVRADGRQDNFERVQNVSDLRTLDAVSAKATLRPMRQAFASPMSSGRRN